MMINYLCSVFLLQIMEFVGTNNMYIDELVELLILLSHVINYHGGFGQESKGTIQLNNSALSLYGLNQQSYFMTFFKQYLSIYRLWIFCCLNKEAIVLITSKINKLIKSLLFVKILSWIIILNVYFKLKI